MFIILFLIVLSTANALLASQALSSALYEKLCQESQVEDTLLFDYSTKNEGCKLDCILLKSSDELGDYWTQTIVKPQMLSGYQCGNSFLCFRGKCTRKKPSEANFTIIDGYFPYDDFNTEGDAFFKIFLNGQYYGRTHQVEDTHRPHFDYRFRVSSLTESTTVSFQVWDKDPVNDDMYGTIVIRIKDIVSRGLDSKPQRYEYGSKRGFFMIKVDLVYA